LNKSIIDKASLKEQLQINVLQVFEDVNLTVGFDEEGHSDEVRDQILDRMCDVIIETVNKA
jgi:hypothetical protein